MLGYFTPPGRGDASLGTLQPIIVAVGGQVRFWCGTTPPGSKRLAQNYALLGKDANIVRQIEVLGQVDHLEQSRSRTHRRQ